MQRRDGDATILIICLFVVVYEVSSDPVPRSVGGIGDLPARRRAAARIHFFYPWHREYVAWAGHLEDAASRIAAPDLPAHELEQDYGETPGSPRLCYFNQRRRGSRDRVSQSGRNFE